jgi:dTDP-4-amino-4,6-dideoxygalactose transaminase
MFSFSKQSINKKDISSVIKVLNSDYLTQGGQVPKFEKKIIKLVNAKYGVAVNSGSSALHLACLALDLKKNDNVWTVPNTYAATVNCAINCGAIIDFVDIDPRTWNISVEKLELKLRSVPKKNYQK